MGGRSIADALSDGARRDAVRRRAARARAARGRRRGGGGGDRRRQVRVPGHLPDLRQAQEEQEGRGAVEGGVHRRAPPQLSREPPRGVRGRVEQGVCFGAAEGGWADGRRLSAVSCEAAGQPDHRRGQAREPEPRGDLRARRAHDDPRHEPGQLSGRGVQAAQPARGLPWQRAARRLPRAHLLRGWRRGGVVCGGQRVCLRHDRAALPHVASLRPLPLRPPRRVGQGVGREQRRRLEGVEDAARVGGHLRRDQRRAARRRRRVLRVHPLRQGARHHLWRRQRLRAEDCRRQRLPGGVS